MALKDKEERRAYHAKYMKEVWYPANKVKQVAAVAANKKAKLDKIDAIKLASGCKDCGYSEDAVGLDFDHLRDKKFNVSEGPTLGKGWKLIEEEIAKCEVVCAICHRKRTKARLQK